MIRRNTSSSRCAAVRLLNHQRWRLWGGKQAFNRRVCAAWTERTDQHLSINSAGERRMRIKVIFLRAAVGCITSGRYFQRCAGAAVQLPETFCSWRADRPSANTASPSVCVITATSAILHSQMSTTRSVSAGLGILYSEMQSQPDWKDPTPPGKQAAAWRRTG